MTGLTRWHLSMSAEGTLIQRETKDEPTLRCHLNPFIGALGILEPVIPGELVIKRKPMGDGGA